MLMMGADDHASMQRLHGARRRWFIPGPFTYL